MNSILAEEEEFGFHSDILGLAVELPSDLEQSPHTRALGTGVKQRIALILHILV